MIFETQKERLDSSLRVLRLVLIEFRAVSQTCTTMKETVAVA